MMANQWFAVTSSIKNAIHLLNGIDDGKLTKLLNRVAQKLHKKNEKAFTEEEEEKLQAAFDLSSKDLGNILDTISFVLEQAAYHNAKSNALGKQLQALELTEEKIVCFLKTWSENSTNIIEEYRKRSFAPKQLDTVNWELRLQTAQANKTKMKIPSSIVELGLVSGDSQTTEKLQYEFNHEELYEFFQKLETIQSQLDSLNKK